MREGVCVCVFLLQREEEECWLIMPEQQVLYFPSP